MQPFLRVKVVEVFMEICGRPPLTLQQPLTRDKACLTRTSPRSEYALY